MAALDGASQYLNNLLLARGLLQNGKPIDFAQPQKGEEDTDATMAKIVNLIHELVLRRDRESEQQEAMAATIRTLRAEESQRLLDFQRIQDKNIHFQSEINTLLAQERALKSTLKRAEAQTKDLREQTLKLKSMVDQVRAKCISDVRKKDLEIEKLKGHIGGLQRGRREAAGMKINTINCQPMIPGARERRGGQDVNTAEWSLENETNEFLAALVNETSGENVSLRQIVQETISTLNDLTGLEIEALGQEEDGIGIPGQYRKSRRTTDDLVSCQHLAQQMTAAVEHCRTILKDPSFVPIEEVAARDEEILKLRAGWEKMADRWKEAITLMSQWKQRMITEGKATEMGEFSDLSFGRSIAVLPNGQPVLGDDTELSSIYEAGTEEQMESSLISSDQHPLVHGGGDDDESELELEPEPIPKRLASSPAKRGLRMPKPAKPLTEIDVNVRRKAVELSSKTPSKQEDEVRVRDNELEKPMTIKEKLAAVEAEAAASEIERKNTTGHKRKAVPRDLGLRKTSRRRSTLSPEELATLMKAR